MGRVLKLTIRVVLVFIAFSFVPYHALAEDSTGVEQQKTESDVYGKFFEVIGAKHQYEEMLNSFRNQLKQSFLSSLIKTAQDPANYSDEEKKEIRSMMQETMQAFVEEMNRELPKVISYEKMVNDVYAPIYAKHFNEDEIREIIAFFERPVGKKYLEESSLALQEAMKDINTKFVPLLSDLGSKVGNKQGAKFKEQFDEFSNKQTPEETAD